MRGKSFASTASTLPIGLSDHDSEIGSDVVTTLFINFEWRRLISDALQFYADSILRNLDLYQTESEVDDFRNKFQALLNDLYTAELMDNTPVGTISAFFSDEANIPDKWLLCDGATHDIADYPDLAAILPAGYAGGSTFTVPDLSNRFLFGTPSPTGGVGASGGESDVTLTTAQIPAHSHVQRGKNTVGGAVFHNQINASSTTGGSVATTTPTGDTGGGGSHNNIPPYVTVNYIIKALP